MEIKFTIAGIMRNRNSMPVINLRKEELFLWMKKMQKVKLGVNFVLSRQS